MVKVATKTCSKCHACKPVNLFRKKHNQCKACEAAKRRKYRQENKETIAARHREYNKANKEEINARNRKRRKNDPEFNLLGRLRCRMSYAVKAAVLDNKCASTIKLLGISPQGLKEWLEEHFTEGMTWENRSD